MDGDPPFPTGSPVLLVQSLLNELENHNDCRILLTQLACYRIVRRRRAESPDPHLVIPFQLLSLCSHPDYLLGCWTKYVDCIVNHSGQYADKQPLSTITSLNFRSWVAIRADEFRRDATNSPRPAGCLRRQPTAWGSCRCSRPCSSRCARHRRRLSGGLQGISRLANRL